MRNDELNETVARLRADGHTFDQIARKLKTTRSAIAGRCARLGLSTLTPRTDSKERDQRIIALIKKGLLQRDIAARFGISQGTVSAAGVKAKATRPRREIVRAPEVRVVAKVAPVPVQVPAPVQVPVVGPDTSYNVFFISAAGCRFTPWSAEETDLDRKFVCGAPKSRGSFCAFHAALAYVAPRDRRAA